MLLLRCFVVAFWGCFILPVILVCFHLFLLPRVIVLQILAGNADACSVYTAYLSRSQNFDRLEVTNACSCFTLPLVLPSFALPLHDVSVHAVLLS